MNLKTSLSICLRAKFEVKIVVAFFVTALKALCFYKKKLLKMHMYTLVNKGIDHEQQAGLLHSSC